MLSVTVTPQFSHIDGFRHVNFQVLPMWFELGREKIYRIFTPEYNLGNLRLIMAHIEVDYLGQLYLGTDVKIRTFVKTVGNSSFRVYQEAWQHGELCAKGEVVLVHFDFTNQKPLRIADDLRQQLEQYLYKP